MEKYIIYTDSACDIKPDTLEKWNVRFQSLTFSFEDSGEEASDGEFYSKMRSGKVAKTSAINMDTFKSGFEELLKQGYDILYLGFSSGLSSTYNSARCAAEELKKAYPEQKIITIDTLSASAGQGLLLYLTVQKKKSGASIEEAAAYAEKTKENLCHWFTVDDLKYLKRGGRISSTATLIGGVLGIKPILHMDMQGHLVNVSKVRGRRTSLESLAGKYNELCTDKSCPVFISHADCMEDVKTLTKLVKQDNPKTSVEYISDIGPVIGAHAGPGTISLFFVGKER